MTDPITLAEAVREYQARKNLGPQEAETRTLQAGIPSYPDQLHMPDHEARAPGPRPSEAKPSTNSPKSLSERLFVLFGGGEDPSRRWTLYSRIQLTVQNFGKPAQDVLREVCDAARLKRRPGNYFA